MNRKVPLVEVEILGGAQAGWSEEEASDVAPSSLSVYETNTEYLEHTKLSTAIHTSISITLGILE